MSKSLRISWPAVIITLTFVISRVWAYQSGVRMVLRPLYQGIQILDPVLLRTDLLQSLIHLHSQPPLYNLFLGVVLKLFPATYAAAFQWIYWLAGYALGVGLYRLMRRLDVPRWLATVLTVYFLINPAVILLENWLMYTLLIMTGLVWSAVFLHRYLSEGKAGDGAVFFVLLAALVLTKGIFHLCWYILLVVMVAVSRRVAVRQVLAVSVLPFVLIAAVYVKNFILFGSLTTSKVWVVFNLGEMTVKHVGDEQLERYCREGRLNFTACERALGSNSPEYKAMVAEFERRIAAPPTGVAVLDQVFKPTSGHINWHSRRYLMAADEALQDSLFLLRRHPDSYFKSLRRAFRIMFYPAPTDVTFGNRKFLAAYENIYNLPFAWANHINDGKLYSEKLLLWYEFENCKTDVLSKLCYFGVIFFYLVLFQLGVRLFFEAGRQGPQARVEQVMLFFLLFNIVYLPVASNLFSWVASNRYRFVIEPFNLALLAVLLTYYFNLGTKR